MRFFYLIIVGFFINNLPAQTIDAVLEQYKKDPQLKHASFAFSVLDASTGTVLKEYNSELALVPASTLKIVTTSAALGILGKNYTYKTTVDVLYNGESIEKSTAFNLLVTGSGDPSFNSSYFYNNDSLFFLPIIQKLKAKKINITTDELLINNSYFDNNIPSTWIWGDIGNYFGAGANGLSYKDNKFSLFYNSGTTNSKANLENIKPPYFASKMKILSDVLSYGSDDEAYVYGDPMAYTREVRGAIPANKNNYEVEAQMPEPPLFFKYELIEKLYQRKLVSINKNVVKIDWSASTIKSERLHTFTSPKLEKIIQFTNVKSNNHYAESLLKTIGAIKTGKQGTTENGIEAVKNYWKSRGVDVTGLNMADGSGLSRANTITTKIQATILSKIYKDSTLYNTFNASLPIAGKNGSMTNLCKGTYAENNLRAKTGYINRARGYCGYVKTKKGKELAFSVLFNNYDCTAHQMKLKIEQLLEALTEL